MITGADAINAFITLAVIYSMLAIYYYNKYQKEERKKREEERKIQEKEGERL